MATRLSAPVTAGRRHGVAPRVPSAGTANHPMDAAPVVLDPRERALVSLLVAGHTDASAARRLHVSPRTVTNMLRALMDRMGVNNRFQLGVAIGLRTAAHPASPHRRPATRTSPASR